MLQSSVSSSAAHHPPRLNHPRPPPPITSAIFVFVFVLLKLFLCAGLNATGLAELSGRVRLRLLVLGRSIKLRIGEVFADLRPRVDSGSESSTVAFVFGGRPRRFAGTLAAESGVVVGLDVRDLRGRPRGRFAVPAGVDVLPTLLARSSSSSTSMSSLSFSFGFSLALGDSFCFAFPFFFSPTSFVLPTISSTPLSSSPSLSSSSSDDSSL